jgi:ATP sulfurylase
MNTITGDDGKKHLLSVPITLDISAEQKAQLEGQTNIPVTWKDEVVAVIEEPEFYENRKEEICTKTFGTRSLKHQRVALIEQQGDYLISGANM